MIRNIFIPEQISGYYLFAQRIIGIDITKTDVFVSQIYIRAKKVTLEKFITVPLENNGTYQERVADALKKVMSQVDSYNSVHTSISSSYAIFKTLHLPFTSYEKIKMVIGYEVEPLLPFSLADAVIDFIITKQDAQSSEVFVVAIKHEYVAEHIEMCNRAGIKPTLITVDMLALYAILQQFPDFEKITAQKNVVLLDFGAYETRLAYLYNGQLKLIRTISRGFFDLAKNISKQSSIPVNEALEHLMRFGFEKNSNYLIEENTKTSMNTFLQELMFTLSSFAQQTGNAKPSIDKILLLGEGTQIKGIAQFMAQHTSINCEPIKTNELLRNPSIEMKQKNGGIPSQNLISLGTAFGSWHGQDFNLQLPTQTTTERSLLITQLLVALGLSLAIILALFIATFLQIRSLKNEVQASAQETTEELATIKTPASSEEEEADPLEALEKSLTEKERAVSAQKKMVAEFSTINRESFLTYLLELAQLNKEDLGLMISHATITPEKIIISGSVKNEDARRSLRQALRESTLFGTINPPEALDKTSFENVHITINKQAQRSE